MPVAAFDTLKLAHLLHQAGHPRKTADGTAAAIQEVLGESYTGKTATIESIETLGRSIDQRLNEVVATQSEHTARFTAIEATQSEHTARFTAIDERFDDVMKNQQSQTELLNTILKHLRG